MERIVQKFSIVYLSTQRETEVYRSMDEIPPPLREKLIRIARKSHIETLVIANEHGRDMLQQPKAAIAAHSAPVLTRAWKWAIGGSIFVVLALSVLAAFLYR
ncbi:MAG: hypothetical protein HY820_43095 [Acidobacteria bacterium]|nr:hypothetical protein [Acidobacteriota bacterium]